MLEAVNIPRDTKEVIEASQEVKRGAELLVKFSFRSDLIFPKGTVIRKETK